MAEAERAAAGMSLKHSGLNAALDGIVTNIVDENNTHKDFSINMNAQENFAGSLYSEIIIPPELGGGSVVTRSHNRILLSFDLTGLAGAAIQSAELRVHLNRVEGDPFTACGIIRLDHVYYGTDLSDLEKLYVYYAVTPYVVGPITTAVAVNDWASIDATATVQADVNVGRGWSQYRLYHEFRIVAWVYDEQFVLLVFRRQHHDPP